MVYEFNTTMLILIIAMIPSLVSFGFLLSKYIKDKRKELFLLFLISFTNFSSTVANLLIHLTHNPIWKSIALFHSIIWSLLMILFVDTISKEHLDSKKILITAFLSGIMFMNIIDPDSFNIGKTISGDWILLMNNSQRISNSLLNGWTLLIIFYYLIYLVIKSPPKLKKYVFLIFGVAFIIGIIVVILTILQISAFLPYLDVLSISIAVAILTIIFTFQPKLFYVLPFKALRMTVLDTNSGSFLYDFQWEKKSDMINDVLYSGMMQGVRTIIKESMNRGDLNEIRTEGAIIILEYDKKAHLACVLASTKSSKTLHEALERFSIKFNEKFSQHFTERHNLSLFKDSDSLIKEVFGFLPQTDLEEDN